MGEPTDPRSAAENAATFNSSLAKNSRDGVERPASWYDVANVVADVLLRIEDVSRGEASRLTALLTDHPGAHARARAGVVVDALVDAGMVDLTGVHRG